jgi:hypothetical protein
LFNHSLDVLHGRCLSLDDQLKSLWLVEVGFEVGERGPHAAAAAHGDLVGGHLRHGPLGGEECRQLLGGGRRELKEKMLGI